MARKCKTQEQFIEDAKQIHNNFYDYSLVNYITSKQKVKIICPTHGEFEQTPNNHLKGAGCPDCYTETHMTKESFIEEASKKFNNKFDYSLLEDFNSKKPVTIVCPKHGEFKQMPHVHLRNTTHYGCQKCKLENMNKYRLKDFSTFVIEANTIHNNKYKYIETGYENSHSFIKIICPIHGEFEQRAYGHLSGRGCFKCASKMKAVDQTQFYRNNELGKEMGHLYQIRMTRNDETFYKIGITRRDIETRFDSIEYRDYEIEILDDILMTNLECAEREKELVDEFQYNRIIPNHKFKGWTECFSRQLCIN